MSVLGEPSVQHQHSFQRLHCTPNTTLTFGLWQKQRALVSEGCPNPGESKEIRGKSELLPLRACVVYVHGHVVCVCVHVVCVSVCVGMLYVCVCMLYVCVHVVCVSVCVHVVCVSVHVVCVVYVHGHMLYV